MIFVGIDPGKHGAIAGVSDDHSKIDVIDCPLVGDDYDFGQMGFALRSFLDGSPCNQVDGRYLSPVVMESVHSMPHDGKCSAFTFGKGYGAWLGLIGSLWITPTLVDPRKWKRAMLAGVANDKNAEAKALEARFAGKLPKGLLFGPRGGLKDGRVDALFLAEYGRCQWRTSSRTKAA